MSPMPSLRAGRHGRMPARAEIPDHRQDRARDDVPFAADRDRNHRLDVEDVLRPLLRPEVEIRVVLERQADQVADRVLRELRELFWRSTRRTRMRQASQRAMRRKPYEMSERDCFSRHSPRLWLNAASTASTSASFEKGLRSSVTPPASATDLSSAASSLAVMNTTGTSPARGGELRLHFEAGESVHVDVDDRAVGTARRERREKRFAGREGGDLVVGETQQSTEGGANRRLVVDHGDIGTVTCHATNVTASRAGP